MRGRRSPRAVSQKYATKGSQWTQERLQGTRFACPWWKSQCGFTGSEQRTLGKRAEAGEYIKAKETALRWEECGERPKEHTEHRGVQPGEVQTVAAERSHAQEGQFSCYTCIREAKQER